MDGTPLDCGADSPTRKLYPRVGDFYLVNLDGGIVNIAIGISSHFFANLSGIVSDRSRFCDLAFLSTLTDTLMLDEPRR